MANPRSTVLTVTRPVGRPQALLLALAMAAAATAVAGPVRAAGGDGLRQEANEYRASEGLQPVVGTALLDDIADHRAAQMVAAKDLEHDMDYVRNRLNNSGVCWSGYGEIIAWERGYPEYSYERTMSLWWNSPMHHDVMMGEAYNAAGAAWDRASDGSHYSVMVFVTLCGSSVAGEAITQLKIDRKFDPDRPVVFRPGTYTGYRLTPGGDILARKTVTFGSGARTTAAGHTRVDGKPWMKISAGPLAGYWVRETPNAYLRGESQRARFDPDRELALKADHYVGLTFDWLGTPRTSKKAWFKQRVYVDSSSRAVISGRPYFLVTSGSLAGYWIADTDRVNYR